MTRKESKCVTLYILYEGLTLPESSRTTPFQRMIALATFVYVLLALACAGCVWWCAVSVSEEVSPLGCKVGGGQTKHKMGFGKLFEFFE